MRAKASVVLFAMFAAACSGESAGPIDPGADAGPVGRPQDAGAMVDAGTTSNPGAPDGGSALPQGQVRVTGGIVEGTTEGSVYSFKGVPFAAAPTGSLRFKGPEQVVPWNGVRPAQVFGPACPQRSRQGQFNGDEDCLQLNVWADLAPESPRPVMVWIHGGGFIQGASSVSIYDGARLAEDGEVVVVTINYRLGSLGFLALPELAAENPRNTAGNYGILDQIFALEWVRDNIAGFGGDPNNVTIFGESAGGSSVCALLAAPDAGGLFHRAAIQSGGGCFSLPRLEGGNDSAVAIGELFTEAAGCGLAPDRVRCLRDLSAEDLTSALFNIPSSGLGLPDVGPAVDGVVLPTQALVAYSNDGGNEVPVLIGSNRDETVTFNGAVSVPSRAIFETLVAGLVGAELLDAVLALYPESNYPDPKDAYNVFSSDIAFNCTAESFARVARAGPFPAYLYAFSQQLSGPVGAQGVLHGQEIAFVFGTLNRLSRYVPTAADAALSAVMLRAWSTFARTGVPAVADPSWPVFDPDGQTIMRFSTPRALDEDYRNGRCSALRALGLLP